jgi:hypothetical protein
MMRCRFRVTGRAKAAAWVALGVLVHRPLPASAKRIHLTPALGNDPT